MEQQLKNLIPTVITTASLAVLGVSAPALSQNDTMTMNDGSTKAETPVVVERNAKGKATKVRIGGEIIDVCMNDRQDQCINPRAAKLGWGDRPLETYKSDSNDKR